MSLTAPTRWTSEDLAASTKVGQNSIPPFPCFFFLILLLTRITTSEDLAASTEVGHETQFALPLVFSLILLLTHITFLAIHQCLAVHPYHRPRPKTLTLRFSYTIYMMTFKLCMVVALVELYPFIPVLVTLAKCDGHSCL